MEPAHSAHGAFITSQVGVIMTKKSPQPPITSEQLIAKGIDIYNFDYNLIDLSKTSPADREELFLIFEDLEKLKASYSVKQWFPEKGPFRRALYDKHTEFFAAGKFAQERLFLAGNRCGKSIAAAVEYSFHATGLYPEWWKGYRFKGPIKGYASGKTAKNTRDICQFKLLGEYKNEGTGTIPAHCLVGTPVSKPGVPQAYELVSVQHHDAEGKPDGISVINLKSYDQGQEAYMGTEVHLAWEDEEPPLDVHSETLVRLMTTNGLLMLTFTPLEGMTEVVTSYLTADLQPDTSREHVHVSTCGWDDVPHLSEKQKARLLSSTPPHLREARSKGIPSLGSGAVYPVKIEDFAVEPRELPHFWPRAYGMDVGWNKTAALWGALDRETDTLYIYSEYYKGQEVPAVHASGVKARGEWIPGICDFSGTNLDDGSRMFDKYLKEGLLIVPADKAVEAGVFEVYQRLVTGRLKIFNDCLNFFKEFRLYQRDKNGKIIKSNDHLMDSLRYLCMLVHEVATVKPVYSDGKGSLLPGQRQYVQGESRWAM